ncbi:MAG: hypothetical protein ACM3MF_05860 [Anaerolineae bacterium]
MRSREWLSTRPLAAILLLGFLAGLACFAVVPPWWHYDEPGHFEYAWLAAHSYKWPVEGQYDQSMRRQMARSMLSVDWYRIRNISPDLHGSKPIPIGVPQVGDQPGYYFLVSLPLRLLAGADLTLQYDAEPTFSLLLFLLIVVVTWYALGEFLPADHPLRWMATAFVATLPAFVDTMVSVNNDVGAVLAASLALWACLRLICRGFSLGRVAFLVITLAACFLSKSTALFMFALAPVALLLALLRGRYALLVWGAAALVVMVLAAGILQWGSPRAWYPGTPGNGVARTAVEGGPAGTYAFQLDDSQPGGTSELTQVMSPDSLRALRGKPATLGAWIWADQVTQAGPLFVSFVTHDGVVNSPLASSVDVTASPSFHAVTFDVPVDAVYATVHVQQVSHGLSGDRVFFDGIVLVPGGFSTGAPGFTDATGTQGRWDGQPFTNLVRNPSAEEGSFQIRQSIDRRTSGFLAKAGINLPAALTLIQDWQGNAWYYQGALATLFRTFWASLAGDKAVIRGSLFNILLILLTVAGLVGSLVRLWTRRRTVRWDLVGFLGIAFVIPWLVALARASSDLMVRGEALYPWARYAYPAILPSAVLLCAGWLEWLDRSSGGKERSAWFKQAVFLGIMLLLAGLAIGNAMRVFHPLWALASGILLALVLLLAFIFYLVKQWRRQPAA